MAEIKVPFSAWCEGMLKCFREAMDHMNTGSAPHGTPISCSGTPTSHGTLTPYAGTPTFHETPLKTTCGTPTFYETPRKTTCGTPTHRGTLYADRHRRSSSPHAGTPLIYFVNCLLESYGNPNSKCLKPKARRPKSYPRCDTPTTPKTFGFNLSTPTTPTTLPTTMPATCSF